MPNFSTKEMKAAVCCTDDKIERLPDESVCNIKELFAWLVPKKRNSLVVLAFAGHCLHKDDAKELKALMDAQKVVIVSQTEGVMTLKTKKGFIITVQVVAGSAWFIDRRDSGASESSYEDATNWNLTQELNGLEHSSDDDSDANEDED